MDVGLLHSKEKKKKKALFHHAEKYQTWISLVNEEQASDLKQYGRDFVGYNVKEIEEKRPSV